MTSPIILYDIPAADSKNKCWSPNLWKARYTLNIKGLAYKTEWVEYPDIEPLCKKIGAAPTGKWPDGTDYYSLPVIYDPSTKKVVSESAAIAKYLDETYPNTPTLFPEGTAALQTLFLDWVGGSIILPLFFQVAATAGKGLNQASQAHYREKREWQLGGKLEELATEEKWVELEAGLAKLKGYCEANGEGKSVYLGGDRVIFADIQLASLFVGVKVVDRKVWERVSKLHGGRWARYMEYFEAYETVEA